jgi:hypothetical protein
MRLADHVMHHELRQIDTATENKEELNTEAIELSSLVEQGEIEKHNNARLAAEETEMLMSPVVVHVFLQVVMEKILFAFFSISSSFHLMQTTPPDIISSAVDTFAFLGTLN